MARIVVAGAGAVGASVAYHLALAGPATSWCATAARSREARQAGRWGWQQFSTAPAVRLAQESIRFFEELGPPYFLQAGYLFVAATTAGVDAVPCRVSGGGVLPRGGREEYGG